MLVVLSENSKKKKENMVNVLEAHRELWNLIREYDQYLRMKVVR